MNPSSGGNGATLFLNTGKYGQGDTCRFGTHSTWKPAYIIRPKDRDSIPQITPVNPMLNTLFSLFLEAAPWLSRAGVLMLASAEEYRYSIPGSHAARSFCGCHCRSGGICCPGRK